MRRGLTTQLTTLFAHPFIPGYALSLVARPPPPFAFCPFPLANYYDKWRRFLPTFPCSHHLKNLWFRLLFPHLCRVPPSLPPGTPSPSPLPFRCTWNDWEKTPKPDYHWCFIKHALTSIEASYRIYTNFLPSKQLRFAAAVSSAWGPPPFLARQACAVFVFLRTLSFVWIASTNGAQFARERTSGFQEWREIGVVLWWDGLHLSSLSTEIQDVIKITKDRAFLLLIKHSKPKTTEI